MRASKPRGGILPLALALVACSGGTDQPPAGGAPSQLAAVRERGVLRMVCFPHQENVFVHVNLAAGPMPRVGTTENFKGIDVDLINAFAESLGVGLEIHPVHEPSYAALIPAILAGEGDLAASSLSITEERKKKVVFSDPYFVVKKQVVVREGSPIRSVEDLRGKVASLIPGSSQEEYLKSIGFDPSTFHQAGFTLENYTAVHDGEVDFTVVDSSNAERLIAEVGGLEIAFNFPGEDNYGIALPPGSDLLEPLNRFLAEMKQNGELERIIDRHMKAYNE